MAAAQSNLTIDTADQEQLTATPSPSADNPDLFSPKRTGLTGHDQNRTRLLLECQYSLNEFSYAIELIRMLKLESTSGRLVRDFIQFRHILAHQTTLTVVQLQMLASFAIFCRQVFGCEKVSHQPKTTEHMCKTFPRMTDLNFWINARCFSNFVTRVLVEGPHAANGLNESVRKSSFAKAKLRFKFCDLPREIEVAVDGDDFKELEGVFDEDWVERLESMVMNKAVRYSDEEIEEIQELYATINNLL
jgi:hypothetical protein